MKKLMFALVAGVAATVATAASITQSDFETGYTAGTSKPTTVEASKFGYAASNTSEDGSVVKAYDAEVTAYTGDRNAAFVGANNNYLELNTDGGTLYRSINDIQNEDVVGAARNVTSSLYIDTLVQFTVCDSAPEIDGDAKLAIWLQASDDETTTNLMVRAKTYAVGGVATEETFTDVVTNFAIGAANTYKAGTWYRLTVEAVPNVFSSTYGAAGFKIRINSDYVKADRAAFTGSTALVENMVADYKGLVNANDAEATIFLPINGEIASAGNFSPLTLCAVGFSGTGAVDDILFTEDNPFFTAPTTLDFTLTLAENVSSVTYSINGAAGVTIEETTEVKAVPVGATITLSNITTATPVWRSYEPAVAAGDNASVAVDGTNVTLKARGEFQPTDENLTTAGATVSAVDTSTTMADTTEAVAAALNTLGITNEGILANVTTKAGYQALLTWAEKYSYSKSRINAYPFAYERMSADLPIEVTVVIGVNNEVITGFDASQGTVYDAELEADCYKVDAGTPLVLSNFVFASSLYALDASMEESSWNYGEAPAFGFVSRVVDGGVVTFTPATNATDAASGVGYQALTAVAQVGEAQYPSLKAAIDAATAGQTVAVLANCTVTEAITFNYGITLSNDFVVTHSVNAGSTSKGYAFRFANGDAAANTPVTIVGTGSFVNSSGVGSAFLVGNNETYVDDTKEGKHDYGMDAPFAGYLIMNGCTLDGASGNVVKAEYGKFVMNGGSIVAGANRGVKADADAGSYTVEVIINGGSISSSKTGDGNGAIAASAESANGTATIVVNGGQITGAVSAKTEKQNGTRSITIPSNSTAQFSADQTAFCVADYKTAKTEQSGDWYVVTAKVYYTAISLNKATTSLVTNETETLTATLTPDSAADDSVTWTTSDASVATVADGVVTAVGAGTATITVTATHDPTVTAFCTVKVTAPEPTPETPTITPAAGGETEPYTGDDAAAQAAAAATAVNAVLEGDDLAAKEAAVPAPSSVKTTEAKNAYYANIKAVATANNTVKIDFSTAGETAAQASADTAATAVAAELGEVAASVSGGEANIATVPGFYYSILYKASLDASWTEKLPRVLGTGTAVPITVPKAGTAGFYQLKVSPVGKAE